MKSLLIVEPGFKTYKKELIEEICECEDNHIIFACGLGDIIDYKWLEPFGGKILHFSYQEEEGLLCELDQLVRDGVELAGVISYIDPSLPLALKIQNKFILPRISLLSDFSIISNKAKMRALLGGSGVWQPRSNRFSSYEDLQAFFGKSGLKFPVIVKPVSFMAKLGVKICKNKQELFFHGKRCFQIDFWDENLRKYYPNIQSDVLVEEFIDGKEFSVENIISNGETNILGVTEKNMVAMNSLKDETFHFPATSLSLIDKKIIEKMVVEINNILQLENSFSHIEIKKNSSGKFYLIEANNRIGGAFLFKLINAKYNFTCGKLLVDMALGKKVTLTSIINNHPIFLEFLTTKKEGILTNIPAINKGHLFPVKSIGSFVYSGDYFDYSRIGLVIHNGNWEKRQKVLDEFEIRPPIYIKSFSTLKIGFFEAGIESLDIVYDLERKAWPADLRATKETINKRLLNGPTKTLILLDIEKNTALGCAVLVPTCEKLDKARTQNWSFYADNAIACKRHKEKDALRGYVLLSLSSLGDACRGIDNILLKSVIDFIKGNGLEYLIYGMRIPQFNNFLEKNSKENFPVADYLKLVEAGKILEKGYFIAKKNGAKLIDVNNVYYKDPYSKEFSLIFLHDLVNEK